MWLFLRRKAAALGLNPQARKNADTCANYLLAKKAYLDYPTALADGWPIATGVIEGACRHFVKDHLDITGARWGLPGAEGVLMLRALHSSGDFDTYWNASTTPAMSTCPPQRPHDRPSRRATPSSSRPGSPHEGRAGSGSIPSLPDLMHRGEYHKNDRFWPPNAQCESRHSSAQPSAAITRRSLAFPIRFR